MAAANDAAVLDLDADDSSGAGGADYATTFTEDGGAVLVADADAVLADVDNTTLASMTVTLANPLDGTAESLSADTTGTAITASYDAGTGILTLSGADTTAAYQQVLRTVAYDNSSQNPDTTARTVTFTANDGTADSNLATTTVTMAAANDAPVNSIPGPQTTDEDVPLVLSTSHGNPIVISDVDAGGSPVEVSLTATSGTLTLSGTAGLTFTSGDGASDTSMTFRGTTSDINAALDGLTYAPQADFSGSATLEVAVNDLGNSGTGPAQADSDVLAIDVVSVNDIPQASSDTYATDQFTKLAVAQPGVLANDTDLEGSRLAAVLVSGPAHGTLVLNANGTFTYQSDPGYYGSDHFFYSVSDGTDTSAPAEVTITIDEGPPPPSDTGALTDTSSPHEDATSSNEADDNNEETHVPVGVEIHTDRAPAPQPTHAVHSDVASDTSVGIAVSDSDQDHFSEVARLPAEDSSSLPLWHQILYDTAPPRSEEAPTETPGPPPTPPATWAALGAEDSAKSDVSDSESYLTKQLEAFSNDLQEDGRNAMLTVSTVAGLSAAISVGYVMWTMRGTYMAMSVLAATPLWAPVDPLPIVEFSDAEREEKPGREMPVDSDDSDEVEFLFSSVHDTN